MVGGRVNFPSMGSVKGNMPLIWQRPFGVIPGEVSFILFFQLLFLEPLPLTFLNNYPY